MPGFGTALLACCFNENYFDHDSNQGHTPGDHQLKNELQQHVQQRIRAYRKYVLTVGLLQFLGILALLAGWVWALSTSLYLLRDAIEYQDS